MWKAQDIKQSRRWVKYWLQKYLTIFKKSPTAPAKPLPPTLPSFIIDFWPWPLAFTDCGIKGQRDGGRLPCPLLLQETLLTHRHSPSHFPTCRIRLRSVYDWRLVSQATGAHQSMRTHSSAVAKSSCGARGGVLGAPLWAEGIILQAWRQFFYAELNWHHYFVKKISSEGFEPLDSSSQINLMFSPLKSFWCETLSRWKWGDFGAPRGSIQCGDRK